MKKLLYTFLLMLIWISTYSQTAASVSNAVFPPVNDPFPTYLLGLKTIPLNQFKVIPANSITWNTSQINGFNLAVTSIGDVRYPISNGLVSEYIAGDGSKITFPSIPASQVNTDWNSISGVSQLLNKPTLGTAAATNSTDYATAAQGVLAATALQPTGNGSGLTGITKTQVDLGNVDNTTDLNKPISTATQTALDTKLSVEVDGSITNEIELPTQLGQSGKILSTNGTTPSWITNVTGTVTNVSSADANATVANQITTPVITIVSAPKLQTARNIQGVSFDGTGNINPINGTGFVKATGTTLSYDNSTYLTDNQPITLGGDVSGSGATSITTTLASVGTAGTYGIVTTDSKGRVTSGKRTETYSGTTNASGLYTVTYGTTYGVTPNLQYNVGVGGLRTYSIILTASSTTGFTVKVENRTDIAGLLPTFANVNGAAVDVLVTEK